MKAIALISFPKQIWITDSVWFGAFLKNLMSQVCQTHQQKSNTSLFLLLHNFLGTLLCIKACHQIRYLKAFEAVQAPTKYIIQVVFFPQTMILCACGKQNDCKTKYQCIISSVLAFQITLNHVVPNSLSFITNRLWQGPDELYRRRNILG